VGVIGKRKKKARRLKGEGERKEIETSVRLGKGGGKREKGV
jgi:hypothetical protein